MYIGYTELYILSYVPKNINFIVRDTIDILNDTDYNYNDIQKQWHQLEGGRATWECFFFH